MHLNQLSSPLRAWFPEGRVILHRFMRSLTFMNFDWWSKGKFYVLIVFTLYKSKFSVIYRLTLTRKVSHVSLLWSTNQPTHFLGSSLSWRHSIIACLLSTACQKNTCEMFIVMLLVLIMSLHVLSQHITLFLLYTSLPKVWFSPALGVSRNISSTACPLWHCITYS